MARGWTPPSGQQCPSVGPFTACSAGSWRGGALRGEGSQTGPAASVQPWGKGVTSPWVLFPSGYSGTRELLCFGLLACLQQTAPPTSCTWPYRPPSTPGVLQCMRPTCGHQRPLASFAQSAEPATGCCRGSPLQVLPLPTQIRPGSPCNPNNINVFFFKPLDSADCTN